MSSRASRPGHAAHGRGGVQGGQQVQDRRSAPPGRPAGVPRIGVPRWATECRRTSDGAVGQVEARRSGARGPRRSPRPPGGARSGPWPSRATGPWHPSSPGAAAARPCRPGDGSAPRGPRRRDQQLGEAPRNRPPGRRVGEGRARRLLGGGGGPRRPRSAAPANAGVDAAGQHHLAQGPSADGGHRLGHRRGVAPGVRAGLEPGSGDGRTRPPPSAGGPARAAHPGARARRLGRPGRRPARPQVTHAALVVAAYGERGDDERARARPRSKGSAPWASRPVPGRSEPVVGGHGAQPAPPRSRSAGSSRPRGEVETRGLRPGRPGPGPAAAKRQPSSPARATGSRPGPRAPGGDRLAVGPRRVGAARTGLGRPLRAQPGAGARQPGAGGGEQLAETAVSSRRPTVEKPAAANRRAQRRPRRAGRRSNGAGSGRRRRRRGAPPRAGTTRSNQTR